MTQVIYKVNFRALWVRLRSLTLAGFDLDLHSVALHLCNISLCNNCWRLRSRVFKYLNKSSIKNIWTASIPLTIKPSSHNRKFREFSRLEQQWDVYRLDNDGTNIFSCCLIPIVQSATKTSKRLERQSKPTWP